MSLSKKISQRDLDAFRIGIEEQARSEERRQIYQAQFTQDLAKRGVDRVRLVSGDMLIESDVIVETMGRSFCEREVVTRTTYRPEDNRIWVETNLGGTAIDFKDQILIEDKSV